MPKSRMGKSKKIWGLREGSAKPLNQRGKQFRIGTRTMQFRNGFGVGNRLTRLPRLHSVLATSTLDGPVLRLLGHMPLREKPNV